MALTYNEVLAKLTGPGAPFELEEQVLGGQTMRCFKNRERSMREKIANAASRGDAPALVQGSRRISYAEFARLVWGFAKALKHDHDFRASSDIEELRVLVYDRLGFRGDVDRWRGCGAQWLVANRRTRICPAGFRIPLPCRR